MDFICQKIGKWALQWYGMANGTIIIRGDWRLPSVKYGREKNDGFFVTAGVRTCHS
jgi:hypothetical protein